jgi:hypothetical protein
MKKRAVIFVEIDPEAKPTASVTQHEQFEMPDGIPVMMFRLEIVPDELAENTPLSLRTSLAHELGHVVGSLAGTEAWLADPRSKPRGNKWTEKPAEAVIASESEAWDIAREIDPGIDEAQAKRNLDSYKDDPGLDDTLKESIGIDALITALLSPKRGKETVN